MQIQVVQVEVTNRGKFNQAEVAYKNLGNGRLESKKVMSFTPAYTKVADAKAGDQFIIVAEKDDKGYWQWTGVTPLAPGKENIPGEAPQPAQQAMTTKGNTTYAVRDFETAIERAAKQVYIVKQSSLSAAIGVLSVGAKTPPNPDDVLTLAQKFTDWVFAKPEVKTEKLTDMSDDVPY